MQTNVRSFWNDPSMDNTEQISITLSPTQIDEVVRAASRSRVPSLSTLIADSLNAPLAGNGARSPSPEAASVKRRAADEAEDSSEEESQIGGYLPSSSSDPRLSRSLLRGLSLLTCFGPEGTPRGIVELSHDAGMSPSTAHRYVSTLVELGLLQRDPKSRKYRLPGI
jgi:hypothetical protein